MSEEAGEEDFEAVMEAFIEQGDGQPAELLKLVSSASWQMVALVALDVSESIKKLEEKDEEDGSALIAMPMASLPDEVSGDERTSFITHMMTQGALKEIGMNAPKTSQGWLIVSMASANISSRVDSNGFDGLRQLITGEAAMDSLRTAVETLAENEEDIDTHEAATVFDTLRHGYIGMNEAAFSATSTLMEMIQDADDS